MINYLDWCSVKLNPAEQVCPQVCMYIQIRMRWLKASLWLVSEILTQGYCSETKPCFPQISMRPVLSSSPVHKALTVIVPVQTLWVLLLWVLSLKLTACFFTVSLWSLCVVCFGQRPAFDGIIIQTIRSNLHMHTVCGSKGSWLRKGLGCLASVPCFPWFTDEQHNAVVTGSLAHE